MRRSCLIMTMNTGTGMDFFYRQSLFDFIEIVNDYNEIVKEMEREKDGKH